MGEREQVWSGQRHVAFALLVLLCLVPVIHAANDPGHDTLYVVKNGDSNVTGNINVSGEVVSGNVRYATLLYGDLLDIRANGTILTPTSRPAIQASTNALYLDGNGELNINTLAGTTAIIQLGNTVTNAITLNVSGTIRQQGVTVCLANGTNCPGTISGANLTGSGSTNYLSKWTSSATLGTSQVYDTGSAVGINSTSPMELLTINGNARLGQGPAGLTNLSDASVNSTVTTINVTSTTGYPSTGTLLIDQEAITYAGTTSTSFMGATRGSLGTTSASHSSGAIVNAYLTTILTNSTSPKLVITANGSVGIGTTAPSSALQVVGTVTATTFSGAGTSLTGTASSLTVGDLSCTDCIGSTEISDEYLLNTGDTGSGNYTFDTTTLHIDSTNDRIGIGTTTPSQKLSITGNLSSTTDAVFATTSGNVGIGTGAPATKLAIALSTDDGISISQATASKQAYLYFLDQGAGKWYVGKQTDNSFFINDVANSADRLRLDTSGNVLLQPTGGNVGIGRTSLSGALDVKTGASSGLYFAESGSKTKFQATNGANPATAAGDLLINPDGGNVGIGTTGPAVKLETRAPATAVGTGGVRVSNPSYTLAEMMDYANDEGFIQAFYQGTPKVSLRGNGNNYLTGGNVGIGTTNPTSALHVAGDGTPLLSLQTTTPATGVARAYFYNSSGTARASINWLASDDSFRFGDGTDYRLTILQGGNVGIGTTTPTLGRLQVETTTLDRVISLNNFPGTGSDSNGLYIAYNASTTQVATTLRGVRSDFNNNFVPLTGAASNIVGYRTELPATFTETGNFAHTLKGYNIAVTPIITNSGTGAFSFKGMDIQGVGAITQNTAAGSITWTGIDIQMPTQTQTTGTVTSTAVKITGGTVNSGTAYALTTSSTAGNVGIGTTTPANTLNVVGTGNFTSTLFAGSCAGAGCTDIAELYPSTADVTPGDVVCRATDGNATRCTGNLPLLGVVSTHPAIIIDGDHVVLGEADNASSASRPIALKGRVPVNVECPVIAGDYLIPSGTPGYAASMNLSTATVADSLRVIGTSIETCTTGNSTVMAWLH